MAATVQGRRARLAQAQGPRFGLTAGRLVGTLVGAVVVGYLLYVPQYYKASTVDLYTTALYVGIAAMGLNILTGYNGQVSIGHGAFFGLGAYTSALLIQHQYELNFFGLVHWTIGHWPFLPTLLVSAPLCFVVGALIGFPALRVRGLYLALVTLGLAVIFPDLTKRFVKGTGGTNLISLTQSELAPPYWYDHFVDAIADPLTERIGARDQWAFYVTFVIGAALLFTVLLIARSRFGRALIAVRDHEAAAATVGINLARTKVLAFAISALYAGVAGSLSLLVTGTANAGKVETFQLSIQFLVALVIGGTATVIGPMVGSFIVVFAQDWIENQEALEDLLDPERAKLISPAVFGIALIVMMYVMPDGLVGGGRRIVRRVFHSRPPPKPALT
jgi:branched-chain amino acid transport system permease protein